MNTDGPEDDRRISRDETNKANKHLARHTTATSVNAISSLEKRFEPMITRCCCCCRLLLARRRCCRCDYDTMTTTSAAARTTKTKRNAAANGGNAVVTCDRTYRPRRTAYGAHCSPGPRHARRLVPPTTVITTIRTVPLSDTRE